MEQKVVVIIPTYNSEKYLSICLDSVFNQDYLNFDVIVVDDGSTDSTKSILLGYKQNHNNLIILDKNNGGPSSARNIGLDYYFINYNPNGSFILFIDSDDFIGKEYINSMVQLIEKYNVDIACSSFSFFTNGKVHPFKQIDIDKKIERFEATSILIEDKTIQSHSCCKLYKGYLWNNVRYPEGIVSMEDQGTIFKTFCKASRGVFVSNFDKYYYRQDNLTSITKSKMSNKKVIDSIKGYKMVYDYDYNEFSLKESQQLKYIAGQSLAACYLMMYPRYQKETCNDEFLSLFSFIKKEKLIKRYHPSERKEKYKKYLFRISRPLYIFIYRIFFK